VGVPASAWTLSFILLLRGLSAMTVYFAPIGGIPVGPDRLWIGAAAVIVALALLSPRWRVPDWFLHLMVLIHIGTIAWFMATGPSDLTAAVNLFALTGVAAYVGAWFTTRQAVLHMFVASLGTFAALTLRGSFGELATLWTTALLTCYALSALLHVIVRYQSMLASIDSLTGVLNRVGLASLIDRPANSARLPQPLCIALLDLDGFKAINDAQGHRAGDQVLRLVGEELRADTREFDVVARVGGDEFLLILSATPATRADEIVTRLVARLPIGASFGIAEWPPGVDFDAVVHAADSAMYEQKVERRGL
jgi:diguanylate cyclase (GGDEF)-like protein